MASTIKVDNVQNQPGTNIINKCGTTITLGASSDTIALAAGATQTGFGREGSVDLQTGSIKTSGFTPTNGEGYFCNTSGGAFAVTLPAGSAGNIVAFADYTRTFNSNNLTITPNGAEKIGGVAADATLDVDGQSATFVYVDGTEGWINVQETQTSQTGLPPFIQATGGTPSQDGDYEIRTFTGPGTFCVSSLSPSAPENAVDWLVVAGGGGGGATRGAGGAGGGYRESPGTATGSYTVSPLGAAPSAAVTVTVQGYPITVGGGGTAGPGIGGNGNLSTFGCYTSAGGGYGRNVGGGAGGPGGSGGGGSSGAGGSGNTPPTNPAQGTGGGTGSCTGSPSGGYGAGGGGGALVAGAAGSGSAGGAGGGGATSCITGSPVARAGGGGGSIYTTGTSGAGGAGGGGAGGTPGTPGGTDGGCNTGGGGGGGFHPGSPEDGGAGGSGVVIIRYKFQ
jgi:hypothetical protein